MEPLLLKMETAAPSIFFDPRTLGIHDNLRYTWTLEHCLDFSRAKSIKLAGTEVINGLNAWHIQLVSMHDQLEDYWIDIYRPGRVLQYKRGSSVVSSHYDRSNPNDPLPLMVQLSSPSQKVTFRREETQYNMDIEPEVFTLAGLGMQVGTPVSDLRISRRIGYWTGSGLSEDLSKIKNQETNSPPKIKELLATMERKPRENEALEAATWLLLNTPDSEVVERASDLIIRHHIDKNSQTMEELCIEMERVRHRSAVRLLEAFLAENPGSEVRAAACHSLANLFKDKASHGENKEALKQSQYYYSRLQGEFGSLKTKGVAYGEIAASHLSELSSVVIGNGAPPLKASGLKGECININSQKGNVVLIYFWFKYYDESKHHKKLLAQFAGKPFSIVSVNCENDLERARETIKNEGVAWPTILEGRNGPIARKWFVKGWPDTWVIDKQGIIRFRNLRGPKLDDAIEKLLAE